LNVTIKIILNNINANCIGLKNIPFTTLENEKNNPNKKIVNINVTQAKEMRLPVLCAVVVLTPKDIMIIE
jgi:hypothetical protein